MQFLVYKYNKNEGKREETNNMPFSDNLFTPEKEVSAWSGGSVKKNKCIVTFSSYITFCIFCLEYVASVLLMWKKPFALRLLINVQ